MTVKEIKEILAKVPDDADVYIQMTRTTFIGVNHCEYNAEINLVELS